MASRRLVWLVVPLVKCVHGLSRSHKERKEMAEFGEFETKSESKIPVEVEMLEYEYIAKCSDPETLRAIVEVLQSGKEGYYPDVCLRISISV
jgi:hypothetical protein